MLDPTLSVYGPWGLAAALVLALVTQWLKNRSSLTPTVPGVPDKPTPTPSPAQPDPLAAIERLLRKLLGLPENDHPPK